MSLYDGIESGQDKDSSGGLSANQICKKSSLNNAILFKRT